VFHEFMKYDRAVWAVLRLKRQLPRIMHVWEALMVFHEFMKYDKALRSGFEVKRGGGREGARLVAAAPGRVEPGRCETPAGTRFCRTNPGAERAATPALCRGLRARSAVSGPSLFCRTKPFGRGGPRGRTGSPALAAEGVECTADREPARKAGGFVRGTKPFANRSLAQIGPPLRCPAMSAAAMSAAAIDTGGMR